MDFEINRLETLYLLPVELDLSPSLKYRLAHEGFYTDSLKEHVTCYFCNENKQLNEFLMLLNTCGTVLNRNKPHSCMEQFTKTNHQIESPYTKIEIQSFPNTLFQEFRIATFKNFKLNIFHETTANLARDGFYFCKEPNEIKCAFCKLNIQLPNKYNIKSHSKSKLCSMKKYSWATKLKQLDLHYFDKNHNTAPSKQHNNKISITNGAAVEAGPSTSTNIQLRSVANIETNGQQPLAGPSRSSHSTPNIWGQIENRITRVQRLSLLPTRFFYVDLSTPSETTPSENVSDIIEISDSSIADVPETPQLISTEQQSSNEEIESLEFNDIKEYIREATTMGIDQKKLLEFIKSNENGEPFENLSQMVSKFFDYQETQVKNRREDLETEFNCKICFDGRACIIFSPCYHIIACEKCSPIFSKCPFCNRQILSKNRAFF